MRAPLHAPLSLLPKLLSLLLVPLSPLRLGTVAVHHLDLTGVQMNHLVEFLSGAAVWGVLAHLAQTFPVPDNKYAKWALSGIQFALANRNKFDDLQRESTPTP